jgi:inward rectifier potassium channel
MPESPAPPRAPPIRSDGMVMVRRVGARRDFGRDLYHFLRTARWPTLIGLIVLVFLVANAIFALFYLGSPGSIANANGSFEDAFFFSVQTMAAIGYGAMTPVGHYANTLATAEAVFGIILTALSTGILFAKFSSPKPRVLFSREAVISRENGVFTLMFRMGNERLSHLIVEAEIRVTMIKDVVGADGALSRRLDDVVLRRDRTPFFALSWTAYHAIDEKSPLFGYDDARLKRENVAMLITFRGTDDTLAQVVHTRYAYTAEHILYGKRFADVLLVDETGERYVDYRRFHDVLPEK